MSGCCHPSSSRAYGVSGPIARASGVDMDLRRDEPYLAYGELDVPVVTRTEGDCLARFQVPARAGCRRRWTSPTRASTGWRRCRPGR